MSRKYFVDILMGGVARVKDLLDPVDPQDAATKAYVDSVSGTTDHTNLTGLTTNPNPHEVTISQAISQDSGTDISVSELETLTDDSIANDLHKHSELWTSNGLRRVVRTNNADDLIIGENDEIIINPGLNSRIQMRDVDSGNDMSFVLDNNAVRIDVDTDDDVADSLFRIRIDNQDKFNVETTDIRMHEYNFSRDDGTIIDGRSLYTDNTGVVQLGRVLPFYAFSKNDIPAANQTTTRLVYDTLTVNIPQDGVYEIETFYIWSLDSAGTDINVTLELDGNILAQQTQEPQDVAGAGQVVNRQDNGGTVNSGTNQRYPAILKDVQTIAAGPHTITLEWDASSTFDEPTIYQSVITIKRVG